MKKLNRRTRIIAWCVVGVIFLAAAGVVVGMEYSYRFAGAVQKDYNVKVYPGETLQEVAFALQEQGVVRSASAMMRLARVRDIQGCRVGNYDFERGDSYRTVLGRLSRGVQTPVRVTFNSFRSVESLVGAVARKTLADSAAYMEVFSDDSLIAGDGFKRETVLAVFVPDTYEVYWTVTPQEFYERMLGAYKSFWSKKRVLRAKALGMTPLEVATLASIVSQETNAVEEMQDVAGVYINRLRIGMPLQADPTVKFAVGDPTLKRILHRHLAVESPYNTYKNVGLPPGLIAMPSVAAVDAVLDYGAGKGHDYLYFCAKADFSGRHAFARTLSEHNRNAGAYSRELNRRNIR